MNSIILVEKKKFPFFKIKREKTGNITAFTIFNEKKFTAKRLVKKLAREKILNITFERGVSESFKGFFADKINIVTKSDVLFSDMDKIIIKLSGMLGIKEGKLNLGIIPEYKTDRIFKKLEIIRGRLKTLFIFTDDREKYLKYADEFYKKTGIPVIIKPDEENSDCDILIYLKANKVKKLKQKGQLIYIF